MFRQITFLVVFLLVHLVVIQAEASRHVTFKKRNVNKRNKLKRFAKKPLKNLTRPKSSSLEKKLFNGTFRLIPLSYVDKVAFKQTFVPEKFGLLLHEYYDEVYRLYPKYVTRDELDAVVLSEEDPLEEKNDPYVVSLASLVNKHGTERKNNVTGGKTKYKNDILKEKPIKKSAKFTLEKQEELEFTRTTEPPLHFRPFIPAQQKDNVDSNDEE